MLFRRDDLAFFVFGFAKSDPKNLRRDELKAFRMLAGEMLKLDEVGLQAVLANGTIIEVKNDG
ncbi:MAG: type II toxin-antitoxin system RelE/ParE family toxin [Deltaproteobacteria bacterium]|nr:type II toxin-antitoxin system RelE/ParE family toxin [Deltaproteobacteria bacterium]